MVWLKDHISAHWFVMEEVMNIQRDEHLVISLQQRSSTLGFLLILQVLVHTEVKLGFIQSQNRMRVCCVLFVKLSYLPCLPVWLL